MRYLTFALGKGRLAKKTLELFEKIGITCEEMKDKDTRKLIFVNEELKLRFFLAKGPDVPTYVEYGAADIGIVGKDTILEEGRNIYEVLDLGFGKCRMCICGPKDAEELLKHHELIRVATKYPHIAKDYFYNKKHQTVEIIKVLYRGADILILDEPTNHLDIESIQWLEDFLVNSAKAVIVISHDRKFVDNITTRTIEVTMGRIYDYKVNYSQYLILRKERREQQMKQYEEQQKMIQETKDFIERFKGTYSKTLQVQSRVKMLEKLELVEVDEEDTSALRLKFPPSPRSGNYPVIMDGVGKTYGDHVVFKNASLTIERGDKVAFVGKNGEGKSTLVKCIMREIEHEGTLTLGHNVQIGYFAQNQASLLDENLTVFQTIDDVAKGEIRNKIRDLLGAFMFGGPEASMKKVKVLSGGERTRLAMIKLLLEPVNLLILDEPTNHLDMKTKDILKQALMDFDGTLIVVSHDRDFLDGLVTKVYEFGNKKVKEHLCGIYEFLETKKMESLQELEK